MKYMAQDGTIISLKMANSLEEKSEGIVYDAELASKDIIEINGLEITLEKRVNNQTESIDILAQWKYKNHAYELYSTMDENEIIKIIDKIRY